MLHGNGQLRRKLRPGQRITGRFPLVAVHAAVPRHGTQHLFRMLGEIAVHRNAIRSLPQMHPVRHKVYQSLPLLQKQNVGSNLSPRIGLESIVW